MTREELILKAGEEITSNPIELEGFIEGAEWADEHPDLYSVTRKAIARERKYMIDKACQFIYNLATNPHSAEAVESFKKYIEKQ